MIEEKARQTGGFHVGNVGGDVRLDARGDIVIGNKTTTTIHSTTYGFKQEKDKAAFVKQIELLRTMMRRMKFEIEGLECMDEDKKDEMTIEVLQQVQELKKVQEEAEETPVGEEAPKDMVKLVSDYLDKTTTLVEKLQKLGKATAVVAEKLAPYVVKSLSLLANARHLFGLP